MKLDPLQVRQIRTGAPRPGREVLPLRRSPEESLPVLYPELLEAARHRMRKLPVESTFDAAGLVHEAFVQVASEVRSFESLPQCFFAVSEAMDDIVAREQVSAGTRVERGYANRQETDVLKHKAGPEDSREDILMVDEAILKLRSLSTEQAQLVVLRYFNGLTAEETARVLGVSLATFERRWRRLREWLRKELL